MKKKRKISEVAKNNIIVKKHRELFHNTMLRNNQLPYFNPDDVRNTLTIRYNLLENYLREFGRYFEPYYSNLPKKEQNKIKKVLGGKERISKICASCDTHKMKDYITINEIFDLFYALDLKNTFARYILSKTHLSYTIHNKKIQARDYDFLKMKDKMHPLGDKAPQFIYMILGEYIAIHNLMFVSGYKIKEIKSLDKWLKDV